MGKVEGTRSALIALAITSVLIGCGGNNTPLGEDGFTDPAGSQGRKGVPLGEWLAFPPVIDGNYSDYRLTSESERTVEGTDYAEAHGEGNYEIPATEDYVIVSGTTDPLAWAVYHLSELDSDRPVSVEIDISPAGESPGADPLPLSCWLGVTDYTTNSWQWYGPFVQPATLVLNSTNRRDRYVSADHVMSFAMLTLSSSRFASGGNPAGRTAALIDCSVIATLPANDEDYLSTRPHYAAIYEVAFGDGSGGAKGGSALDPETQYVNLHWQHIYDPANDENEALQYKIYRKGPDDEERIPIGSVNAPEEEYTDPEDNATGVDEPLPGVTYIYYLRAYNPAGYTPYDAVPVTIPEDQPPADSINVTAYAIRIDNAANGIGFDPEVFDEEHSDGTIDANAATSLSLEWIAGTYNGLPFSGEDDSGWPEGMTQDDYDTAFAAVRDNLQWLELLYGGAAGFRRTGDWLVLDSSLSFPLTGDPGSGVIFPDDDPESTGAEAEGLLQLYLPDDTSATYPMDQELEVHVPSPVQLEVTMDIGFDPAAAELLDYLDGAGDPLTELLVDQDTFARVPVEWGVGGAPPDLSATSLELHEFNAAGGPSNGAAHVFDYCEAAMDSGQYTFLTAGEDYYVLCIVPGTSLSLGKYYALRLSDGSAWSTINKPPQLLQASEPQVLPELVSYPEHCWPQIDVLQVFYPDPIVRRDPGVYYDFDDGQLKPTDPEAYNDILKTNGDEFFLHVSGSVYPKAAVMETDNPDLITSLDDGIEGVFSTGESPGRILINIVLLTLQGNPGDPVKIYCYKFFNADGTAVGYGTFDVAPIGSFNTQPLGLGWGVNVWNREEREIAERTYDNFTTDGSRVGTSTPDVLWFEIAGGWLFDPDQDEQGIYAVFPGDCENLLIRVQDADQGDYLYAEGALRIAGIGATGSYLIIHTVTNLDWSWPGVPGWPGILRAGHMYDLSLDDPHFPGLEYTYPQKLVVIGTNPNT